MKKYLLSREAQSSLRNIKAYSNKKFGSQKTKTYLQSIHKKMKALAVNPFSGTARDDLKDEYYSAFVGSHTIYYRVISSHIEVIDVLHQSMEPSIHLIQK